MKDVFSKWYSKVDKSGDENRLNNRIELIQTATKDENAPNVYELFCFILNRTEKDEEEVSNFFITKIKEKDGEESNPTDREIFTLGLGTLLFYSVQGGFSHKLKTNLILKILSFEKDLDPLILDLIDLSGGAVQEESIKNRTQSFYKKTLEKDIESQEANLQGSPTGANVIKAVKTLQKAIENLSNDYNKLREENQLLWWLKTEELQFIEMNLNDLLPANRILCTAYDIMRMSAYYSPPGSSKQFILEAYLNNNKTPSKTIAFKNAIESLPIGISEIILEDFNLEPDEFKKICRVLTSLEQAQEHSKSKNYDTLKIQKPSDFLKKLLPLEEAVEILLCEIALWKLEAGNV